MYKSDTKAPKKSRISTQNNHSAQRIYTYMMLFCCYLRISEQHVPPPPWSIVFVWIYTHVYMLMPCMDVIFLISYVDIYINTFHLFNQSTRFLDRLLQMILVEGTRPRVRGQRIMVRIIYVCHTCHRLGGNMDLSFSM